MFSAFQPLLQTWLKDFDDDDASPVLNEVVTALAVLYFVSCNDELATREYLGLLETIFESKMVSLHASAVRAWTLLLTTVPHTFIITKAFPKNIKTLYTLLDAVDVDTRIAVGESIAYLLDVLRHSVEEKEETFDLHKYDHHVDTTEMVEKIKELTFSTNRQCAKKERAKQKGYFKGIMQSIEQGESPEEALVICDKKINFHGWQRTIQLNFIRTCLAEGTQLHMENNPLLQQIFGYELGPDDGKSSMTKVEKRLFLSPNSTASKNRTKTRKEERNNFGRSTCYDGDDGEF